MKWHQSDETPLMPLLATAINQNRGPLWKKKSCKFRILWPAVTAAAMYGCSTEEWCCWVFGRKQSIISSSKIWKHICAGVGLWDDVVSDSTIVWMRSELKHCHWKNKLQSVRSDIGECFGVMCMSNWAVVFSLMMLQQMRLWQVGPEEHCKRGGEIGCQVKRLEWTVQSQMMESMWVSVHLQYVLDGLERCHKLWVCTAFWMFQHVWWQVDDEVQRWPLSEAASVVSVEMFRVIHVCNSRFESEFHDASNVLYTCRK